MASSRPDIDSTNPTVGTSPNDASSASSKGDFNNGAQYTENTDATRQASIAVRLRNPLAGMSEQALLDDVDKWVVEKGLQEHQETFRKGALIARVGQREDGFEYVDQLSEDEKHMLRYEINHRWSQPFMLYFLVVLCAGSAIVQGMDQTAVNGAQVCPTVFSYIALP